MTTRTTNTPRRLAVEALIAVLALSMILAPGCAYLPFVGNSTFVPNYYPKCFEPLQALQDTAQQVKRDTIWGFFSGLALGAVAGLMAEGSLRGAIVGGLIGAAAGALSSNLISREVRDKQLRERLAEYNTAMKSAGAELNTAVKAARTACTCYRTSYNQLKAKYGTRRNRTEEEQADLMARLEEIRTGNNEALDVLIYYKAASEDNLKAFDEIIAQEEARETDRPNRNQMGRVRTIRRNYQRASESVQSNIEYAELQRNLYQDEFDMLTQQASMPGGRMAVSAGADPGL